MRTINEIIVHCSATPENVPYTMTDIDSWHRAKGFREIGYHYVITLDGKIEEGRNERSIGAHCKNRNRNSIGVCYIGGCNEKMEPKDTRTPKQKSALTNLLKELKHRYPNAHIRGHRDFAAKACPSFDATKEYYDL